jgi:hypothetical protein
VIPQELAADAKVIRSASLLVAALEAFPANEIERTIAFREKIENEMGGPYADEAAARAGRAITATLKMILFFRTEILAIQASPKDQVAGLRHAEERLAKASAHVREFVSEAARQDSTGTIRDFLEGAR